MIRKTSETRALAGNIVNAYSESQNSTYSCDYLNGTLLWTNPSPTSSFASQNITLSSDDYDVLEIFFSVTNSSIQIKSTKGLKGQNLILEFYDGYGSKGAIRPINYTNDTTLAVQNSFYNSTSGSANYCIPLYVIGYKTGILN